MKEKMGNTISELASYLAPPTLAELFPSFAEIDEEMERDEVIDILLDAEEFQDYRHKFQQLSPSREIYLENHELIIETIQPYSLQSFSFDWNDVKEINTMYELLDSMYERFSQ